LRARRRLLLLLDNLEQVTPTAPLVADAVMALITSRTVLRIRGEHEFAVPRSRFLRLEPAGTLQTSYGTPRWACSWSGHRPQTQTSS